MPNILVADIEGDGFDPTTIHMVGVLDYFTDEFRDYNGDNVAEGLIRIAQADFVIMHGGAHYDLPVIRRLTGGLVDIPRDKLIETVDMSRKLVGNALPNHKLATWGEHFNFPKGDHHDWTKYSREMSIYCERDCRLTKKIFEFLRDEAILAGFADPLENGDTAWRRTFKGKR